MMKISIAGMALLASMLVVEVAEAQTIAIINASNRNIRISVPWNQAARRVARVGTAFTSRAGSLGRIAAEGWSTEMAQGARRNNVNTGDMRPIERVRVWIPRTDGHWFNQLTGISNYNAIDVPVNWGELQRTNTLVIYEQGGNWYVRYNE